jgi:hypothetical protein
MRWLLLAEVFLYSINNSDPINYFSTSKLANLGMKMGWTITTVYGLARLSSLSAYLLTNLSTRLSPGLALLELGLMLIST